jgi:hypothetical protein
LCRKKRATHNVRKKFFREPFRFAKELFEQPRSGTLSIGQHELEEHMRQCYLDKQKDVPLNNMSGLVWPSRPGREFNTNPPTLQEITGIVDKTRMYKRCPGVLKNYMDC